MFWMACRILCSLILNILLLLEARGNAAGNFPLNDCDTGQFDIVVIETRWFNGEDGVKSMPSTLDNIRDIWTQDDKTSSRVRVGRVRVFWSNDTYVCGMRLARYGEETTNVCDSMESVSSLNESASNVQADIEVKIKIASGVFADTGVRRENSTLVAIIIASSFQYPELTMDEIRRIPELVEKDTSEIKMFLVLQYQAEDMYLRDTIILYGGLSTELASMALCRKCLSGWFSLALVTTNDFMSCYRMEVDSVDIDWLEASGSCAYLGGYLATVESKEELDNLKDQLFMYFLEKRNIVNIITDPYSYSAVVFFGLKRETTTIAKRYQWVHPSGNRPLVVSHWLPDSPTGTCSHSCGVWVYNGILNYTVPSDQILKNFSSHSSIFSEYRNTNSEGWSNVGCGTKLSAFSLCEMSLFHNEEDTDRRIRPTYQENNHTTLSRNIFRYFKGNMVSVTAYASSEEFNSFLKDTNEDFPLFDCGHDAVQPRFIAYSFVCDCIGHCSNRRDERDCLQDECTRCRSGQYIDSNAECDMFKDCDDGSDEDHCDTCIGNLCCDGTCLPPHLSHDGEIDCCECKTFNNVPLNEETTSLSQSSLKNETCAFTCNIGMCVYPSQLNDGHVDCYGSEGPLDETIGKLEQANSCYDKLGRPFWAPKCVFLKDRYGSILGCRDLSHLQNCSYFPCQNGYFKCPGSYCIPLHYVQNGKSDCPSGEEEMHIVNQSCIGNFACWNSTVCLHPDLLCDGNNNCPYKDDELNCKMSCTDGFRCIAGTVIVKRHTLVQLESLTFIDRNTRYLDMSGLDISRVSDKNMPYCLFFYDVRLSRCAIKDLSAGLSIASYCLKSVHEVDLSYNLLTNVNEKSGKFYYLQKLNLSFNIHLNDFSVHDFIFLEILDLSQTGLTYLKETCFKNLPKLKFLNLSKTRLSVFQRHIFPASFTLETLDLRGSPIVTFFENTFNGLIITSHLYTDNFGLCCPQVRGTGILGDMCHASENPVSSCFDLIGIESQRILIWLMAGIALLGNLIVIAYRIKWDRIVLKKAYGMLVLHLGIADLTMGLYLLMIAAADIYYRRVYIIYDKDWTESVPCKFAGFLATLANESSVFFIFLVTVDRFLTLKFPYNQKQFSTMTQVVAITFAWSISFILALIQFFPLFTNESVFTNSVMCIGLLLRIERLSGWEYSLSVFIVLNFVMFLFTAIGQVMIFRSISENRMPKAMTQSSLRRAQDITVAKQLSLVVLSNFACWFPVGVMGILSLSGHQINNDVYGWTVILVMPINAAIDPVLYTIPIILVKWKNFKNGRLSNVCPVLHVGCQWRHIC